jgi:hypothetical protein
MHLNSAPGFDASWWQRPLFGIGTVVVTSDPITQCGSCPRTANAEDCVRRELGRDGASGPDGHLLSQRAGFERPYGPLTRC